MTERTAADDDVTQRPAPLRQAGSGLVIGLVLGIALWQVILHLFGGAGHHFSFGP